VNNSQEKLTLMVVPHSGKSTSSISIPVIALKIVGGFFAVVVACAAFFVANFYISYNKIKTEAEELSIISEDYHLLQRQLEFFIEKTHYLEEKMSNLEQLDTDLRDLLEDDPALKERIEKDNKSVDATKSEASPINESRILLSNRGNIERQRALRQIQLLEQKIPEQEQSLEELKDAVIQRNDRLAHTPSIYPVQGRITSHFGYRRSPFGRGQEFHDGLDIGAPYGTTIRATADGMITFTGYKSGYGYTVTINHGYGFETSYCHNSKILVKKGQQVKKGQAIAEVGSSGRSTGPHVHYMVKVNGQLRNPVDFLK